MTYTRTTAVFTLLGTLATLICVSCGSGPSNDEALPGSAATPFKHTEEAIAQESEKANAFFESAFVETMMRSPMFQTRLGIRDDYDKWDDISIARQEADLEMVKRQLATIRETIDNHLLNRQTKLSYDLFVSGAEQRIANYTFRFHTYPVNQMRGWQSTVPAFLINYHRIDSIPDAEAYIDRLRNVEPLFNQLIENLKLRAAKGIIAPKFVFPYVLSDSRNVIKGAPFDESGDDSTILGDFRKKVGSLDIQPDQRATLMESATSALQSSVRPAYRRLIRYLTQLEEQATDDDGAWKFPVGKSYYASRLQEMTTTSIAPEQIHSIGLSEVSRIHGEMTAIMRKVGFKGTLQDFFEFMRKDKRFYLDETTTGKQAYLEQVNQIIDDMRQRLGDLFNVRPKAELIVKAVESFREKSTGKAFYQRPAPDGSRPGVYYANLYRMADMPTYQMEALAYHEAIPGHHMQLSIAMELEGIPRFRKYARYTAYSEGWGLYSEYIPKEIGFYKDPYSDFGRLAMELWRACRLVVDTGIHDQRWTREEAIDYLVENTPNPYGDVVKAIERYIVMPGQATAYKIGMLKILELRKSAKQRLGDRFDIREFHDVILRNGPVPLETLEHLVNEWIETKTV